MEIKDNDAPTALRIFNYFQYLPIFRNAQVMFEYGNLLHLWMSRQVFWDLVLQKAREDEELFALKSMRSLSEKNKTLCWWCFQFRFINLL